MVGMTIELIKLLQNLKVKQNWLLDSPENLRL